MSKQTIRAFAWSGVVAVALAGLVACIGFDVISQYQERLFYDVLALALAVLGIGERPAILALWLASLLPIVRNTYEGLRNVSPALLEAARGIGMTPCQQLIRVELPNALPVILAGVRISLVINVGTVPLSFLIGANSLGELIFPGIYLNNQSLLLLGAGATALLALTLDALFATAGHVYLRRRGLAR